MTSGHLNENSGKLLRAKFPKLNIVVGLWDVEADEAKLTRRRDRLAVDKVVTTLVEALEYIRPLAVLDPAAEVEANREAAVPK